MTTNALAKVGERLQNLPSMNLPTDFPRSSQIISPTISTNDFDFSKQTLRDIRTLRDSTDESPTAFQSLLAAFSSLIYRHTGDSDVVVAAADASTDYVPIRVEVNPGDKFPVIVRQVQLAEAEGRDIAQELSFEGVLGALVKHQDEAAEIRRSLLRIRFVNGTGMAADQLRGVSSSTSDLTIVYIGASKSSSGPVTLRFIYNSQLFTPTRISYNAAQIFALLHESAVKPDVSVGSVSLMTPEQRSKLPDPTEELDWHGWKGPITDVFSDIARRNPDRPCIIQYMNPSPANPQALTRTYSYGAILKASNVLSHHLLQNGIQREDVITIYAHRSAELSVAVMAVLKAGATFSIIDPAYPPSRQNIYLRVAQPKGLIVLKGAGTINSAVREFIQTELNLRVEVPAFELSKNGDALGSSGQGPDVLDAQRLLASEDPDVVLGPDSIGSLSFTSGSTGIPKGVQGRHFSLTHFFPWMGETFTLNETSRFTMLSGIAHDPIQRDILTPLFFGSRLLIPTADIIGTPGRLAQWMQDNTITTCCLSPAMSQLLTTDTTTQIPTLTNAFITGDLLPKRDCLRIQSLCKNARIINMYGSTETQRAVSYFAIPPASENPTYLATQKDVIPAGVGMVDVQLIVVNLMDRNVLCAPGEVGEVYLRSSGMSEGYIDTKAKGEKFVNNWFTEAGGVTVANREDPGIPFWNGFRDRLYKSGDLGRYTPEGVVEVSGRTDNQIKIRGFRIELGEVDMHLSQHPLVKENATVVRTDKEGDKFLVSYFVPERSLNDQAADIPQTIKIIRDDLKQKLPIYAVPSVIIPLRVMPLNPNGKTDKPNLPSHENFVFEDSSTTATTTNSRKLTPTEEVVQAIWARILPNAPQPIPVDENFFDLGGHSILATKLVFEIRKAIYPDAPLSALISQPTIEELAAKLDELRAADKSLASGETPVASTSKQPAHAPFPYADDYAELLPKLRDSYDDLPESFSDAEPLTVFLTGATGFLGAFALYDLLSQPSRVKKVICLVRASNHSDAVRRLKTGMSERGIWSESWVVDRRLEVVLGDLGQDFFGLNTEVWNQVGAEADAVVHNGALVHWVYDYDAMRAANVLATITAVELASNIKQKILVFVSSTSVLDTKHYVDLSDALGTGIPESDDLEGSRLNLSNGYGQSKWMSEKLLMEAGRRGLKGHIIRPGYIVGDSKTGVTNTDDFIWRMVKGSIELGLAPLQIDNSVNMVPVDHVAHCMTLATISAPPTSNPMNVLHITPSPPRYTYSSILSSLKQYGFPIESVDYATWKDKLEARVTAGQESALFPLLHYVLKDLPKESRAPTLNSTNTQSLLASKGSLLSMTVDDDTFAIYLAWLVGASFLPAPSLDASEKTLPKVDSGLTRAVGRNGK